MMALATRYEVSAQAASSVLTERLPAMCGSDTLTTVVSGTAMRVANMTATATIHGLTWGCGSTEDGIRYYFHDAAKPPFDARSCHAPACPVGRAILPAAGIPAGWTRWKASPQPERAAPQRVAVHVTRTLRSGP